MVIKTSSITSKDNKVAIIINSKDSKVDKMVIKNLKTRIKVKMVIKVVSTAINKVIKEATWFIKNLKFLNKNPKFTILMDTVTKMVRMVKMEIMATKVVSNLSICKSISTTGRNTIPPLR